MTWLDPTYLGFSCWSDGGEFLLLAKNLFIAPPGNPHPHQSNKNRIFSLFHCSFTIFTIFTIYIFIILYSLYSQVMLIWM